MVYQDIKVYIDGVPCSLIMRGGGNGEYELVFRRPGVSLEQVEDINWKRPELSGACELPAGYGFRLTGIDYHMGDKTFHAKVKVLEQYLGDVTGYQAQIDALSEDKAKLETANADKDAAIETLSAQLAEADETAIALFEELATVQAAAEEVES